jgi:TonB family protein
MDRVAASEAAGRWFESSRARQFSWVSIPGTAVADYSGDMGNSWFGSDIGSGPLAASILCAVSASAHGAEAESLLQSQRVEHATVCEVAARAQTFAGRTVEIAGTIRYHGHGSTITDDACPHAAIHIRSMPKGFSASLCDLGQRFSCPAMIAARFTGVFRAFRDSDGGAIELASISDITNLIAPLPICDSLRLKHSEAPEFPDKESRSAPHGRLMLEFAVGTDGRVSDPVVVASDTEPTKDWFNSSALAAVLKWRYEPPFVECVGRASMVFRVSQTKDSPTR